MLPVLETARLLLRPRSLGDLDACLAMNRNPEVMRYVGGLPEDWTAYEADLSSQISRLFPAGLGYWSLFPKQTPARFVGWVSLTPCDGADDSSAEIGWRVTREDWGNGYATEAAGALLRHGFGTVGLERIVATVHPGNTHSMKVARRLGMAFLGDGDYYGEPCKLFAMDRPLTG